MINSNKILRTSLFFFACLSFYLSNAQSGPGGIGDGAGTNGPRNVLWLDASTLGLANDANVTSWTDQSGNGNDFAQQGADAVPTFRDDGLSGTHDIVRFDGTERYLVIGDNTSLDGYTDGMCVFVVANFSTVDANPRGIISKRTNSGADQSYSLFTWTGSDLNFDVYSPGNNRLAGTTALTASTDYILSTLYNGSNMFVNVQSAISGSNTKTGTVANTTSDLILGALNNNYGTYLDADIAEIIIYGENLTQAERVVVENYLSNKYGVSIAASGNDHWSDNATYPNDLAGIGQEATTSSEATTASSSFLRISESDDMDDDDWLFWAHDGGDFTTYTSTEIVFGASHQRLAREWVVNETNDLGEVSVFIESTDLPVTGIDFPDFYVLVDSDGDANFANATSYVMTASGSGFSVDLDLNDGDRVAIAFEEGIESEIWYSYVSGDWSDVGTWTLDGGISPLYVNPLSKVPASKDSVVIRSGRTVTMDLDDVVVTRLEVIGTLDLGATSDHNFSALAGSGVVRLSGASGFDNYPSGDDALFYDGDEGGTLEIYGDGIEMNVSRTTNNLLLNMTGNSMVTMTADAINVNGDMTVSQGLFQFNDNSTTNNLVVEIQGDLTVGTNGGIEVGTANARHELNLYGDFINQGDVAFTNRTVQNTGAEATDGIVDVNFLSPNQDQIVDLQNTTDFYRIEINKGVDDTYIVEINADDESFFNLYGFANGGTGAEQEVTNSNALGLIYGTIKIGNNVTVSPLNASGNYNIYEGAQLWVNGGTVEKIAGTAIVPYGKIRVSAGELNAPINSGITTRNNGQLTLEGGTVTINQFRTSINGASAQGGLIMSGGILNIIGGSTSTNYYTFSLTYEGNVFNMTGGTINISGVNTTGGVYINSSDENINVTGGVINLDVTNNNDISITSRAPFFNMNVLRSSGSGVVTISNGSSGTGAGETTLNPDGLTIFNDLTIDNSGGLTTAFDANDLDLNITGTLIIDNGAVVDLTGMELTFEGVGASSLDIQTGATLSVDSLIISKTNPADRLDILNGAATALQINNLLQLSQGKFNPNTFDITANGSLILSDTVGTSTSTGLLYLNGGAAQAITSTDGFVYDLAIDNANGVSLSGDFGVNAIALEAGVFDINTSQLTSNTEIQTSGTFSATLMVQTGGNPTDGGLEFLFNADETITYPFGIVGNYTPLIADISLTGGDEGYIRVNPVNDKLGTSNDDPAVVDFLNYYWKIESREFVDLPTINSYVFTYIDNAADDDVTGDENNLLPGFVEDGEDANADGDSFGRDAVGTVTDVDVATNEITFVFGLTENTLKAANYTAAESAAFDGAVTVFYSRRSTAAGGGGVSGWTTADTWSNDVVNQHEGAAATSYPGENSSSDVVFMGFGATDQDLAICDPCTIINTTRHDVQINGTTSITVADIVFDQNPAATPLNNIDTRIRVGANATLNATRVTGRGTIFQTVTNTGSFGTINADFNEFNEDPDNGWFFRTTGNDKIILATDRFEYPTLRVFGNNDLSFAQPVTARGLLVDNNMDLFIDQDFTINGIARLGENQGGEIIFGTSDGGAVGSNVTFECDSLLVDDTATSSVSVADVGADTHILRVNGGIDLDQAGVTFDLYNPTTSNVTLELTGEVSNTFENASGNIPELSRLVLNKGTDTTSVFTMNTDFTLNGDNTTVPQALELQNGKLILNNSSISIELADNSDFSIPSGAGLEVTQGTVTSTGSNIILDGLLRINGGTVDLESTDIEYSASGSALIEVSSGALEVGGQVRRATSSSSGILKYRQTGGDVDIATDGVSTSERAAFEVLNTGSEFILTGGTFNIERGVAGDANESLELDPEVFDLTGSTITIFENLDADYGSNFFNIKSNIDLNNLTVSNSIDLPDVQAYVQPLTVNDLVINGNQEVNANNLDLTINGDFTNSGTYTNTSSNTILEGDAAQSVSGGGIFTVFDLTKNGLGTATLDVSLVLDNNLNVNSGILDMGSNTISLKNDAHILSVLTNSTGNGLIFNGTSNQDLYGLANNTVSLGTVTISNPSGLNIPDGSGYNFDLTQNLRLDGGVFDIGGSLVTMKEGSTITEVSPFNINNMVQTNSSFTDNGFVVEFFGIAADTTIFYPVGELKYTPVSFDLLAGTTAGSIRVRPANEIHPTIVDNVEPLTAPNTEIDDTQNILNYYWVVVAASTTGVEGSATFFYDHADIVATESDTSNFISGRLLSNESTWDKFLPTDFLGGSQSFVVPLGSEVTFEEITGDYTAGLGSTDGVTNNIEGALPDELAEYETNFDGSGDYSTAINWNQLGVSPTVTDGVGPVGAQIIVRSGDDLTLDISNIRLFSTEIEDGATLRVPTGVNGIRLGNVTGSGTIVLTDTELLPTGEYSDFFACDGGAIEYSGSTSYSILTGISQVREVTIEGTGTRSLPNNALNVCDVFLINGPTVVFSASQTYTVGDTETDNFEVQSGTVNLSSGTMLDITGDFLISGGSFTGLSGSTVEVTDDLNYSAGTIDWNNTGVVLDGTTEQLIDGVFTGTSAFEDITVNNSSGTGVVINSGAVTVDGELTFTDGLVTTSATEILTLSATGDWTGASATSYVVGPITKENVAIASTYEFPIGQTSRYAPAAVANIDEGGQDWTAEYNTSMGAFPAASFDSVDPGSGFNSLNAIQPNDRWTITSSGDNIAQVRVTYGSHNTYDSQNDLRVCVWNSTDSEWKNEGGILNGTATSGTSTSEGLIHFSTNEIALGTAPDATLPVELLEFYGIAENNQVSLYWITASELNNDFFEVQRSRDGDVFETIGTVIGNGTTNDIKNYSFVDVEPSVGKNFYRLKQVDFDGAQEYHDVIVVSNDFIGSGINLVFYPNPTTGENMNITISSGDEFTPIELSLISITGNVYYQEVIEGSLNLEKKIRAEQIMAQGIYILLIKQGANVKRVKVSIE